MARIPTLKPRIAELEVGRRFQSAPRIGATERTRGGKLSRTRAKWLREHPACASCGRAMYDNQLDHIVPLSEGGADDESNFQTLCVVCHKAKSSEEAKQRAKW